jgi:hydrogenase maturation factor HypF (carbamoyltransferase family)
MEKIWGGEIFYCRESEFKRYWSFKKTANGWWRLSYSLSN